MGQTKIKSSSQILIDQNLDLVGQKITALADPTEPTDAATKRYVDNVAMGLNVKKPVKVVIDINLENIIPLSNIYDDIQLSEGDRVLLIGQENTKENGIYTFDKVNVPLQRTDDVQNAASLVSALVIVERGTNYGDTAWLCTTDMDSNSITFVRFGPSLGNTYMAGDGIDISTDIISVKKDNTLTFTNGELGVNPSSVLLNSNFIMMERLNGIIDGTNKVFTLTNTPLTGKVMLYKNGLLLAPGGINDDYSISGNTIYFNVAPQPGDNLFANYLK